MSASGRAAPNVWGVGGLKETVHDRQIQRTRHALFEAFVTLVMEWRYDQLKVADIVDLGGVGRSTFYEHYLGKDDLLREGLAGPLGALANLVCGPDEPGALEFALQHFWENRRVGNALFAGSPRTVITRTLAELIEARLASRVTGLPPPPSRRPSGRRWGRAAPGPPTGGARRSCPR